MTTEIIICNSNGIALAADSAASMMNGQKIYNSVNKLFMLSKYHPVAIMVYNNAEIMGVPWEVVIKEFRSFLGNRSFDHVSEYCDFFWDFISAKSNWFTDNKIKLNISERTNNILLPLVESFLNHATEQGLTPSDTEQLRLIFEDIISNEIKSLQDRDFLDGFNDVDIERCIENYKDIFDESANSTLENALRLLSQEGNQNLYKLCAYNLIKQDFNQFSGIVIAGYGKEEILPRISCHQIEGFINGRLGRLFIENKSNVQSSDFSPMIAPFAQDDVVRSFIQGIDPNLNQYIEYIIGLLPRAITETIPDEVLNQDIQSSKQLIFNKLMEASNDILAAYRQQQWELGTAPILEMLAVLPKDELAEMAETLVNLTAFKRRMTAYTESVGGPIDVAIISKGDGFIWVRRKHYFEPKLNQHFFHNYFESP